MHFKQTRYILQTRVRLHSRVQ